MIGESIGHYRITGKLGQGGMGEVYRATDSKLGREVAIKVLPDAFASDPDRMTRFQREAQVLASLNHPNIAAIYGIEERAIVMELVEGETLHGPLPLETALNYAGQIADALEAAHDKGITHRDLKPANVKITPQGVVKVLDFGLAKIAEPAAGPGNPMSSPTLTMRATEVGMILGTAAYMAPEQARGQIVDKRADIWAFGVVLWEMLTGKQLFSGETTSDVLAGVLKNEPDLQAVPQQVRRLLAACLEKDLRKRLRDIAVWRLLLEKASRGEADSKLPWLVAGVLTMAAALLSVLLWRSTLPISQPLMRLAVELPELAVVPAFGVAGPSAIISPDGTRVVYTGRGPDGILRLYTRRLDQEKSVALAGTEGAFSQFFSPDGQSVGFFTFGKLKVVRVERGGAVLLCDAIAGRGGSWGEDGNIIAALSFDTGLSRIRVSGGAVQPATELKPEKKEAAHRWPQLLPGAKAVLFTAHTSVTGFDEATIEVQSLRTGERKTLVRGGYYGRYTPSGHLLYVRQNAIYAAPFDLKRLELTGPAVQVFEDVTCDPTTAFAQMDFSKNGTLVSLQGKPVRQRLIWLEGGGRTQTLRAAAAKYNGTLRFSPDGKRLAVGMVENGNLGVWVYDWARDTMSRLTLTSEGEFDPVWTPDGKHIVFTGQRRSEALNLYWRRADGAGEAVPLTRSKNQHVPYSFAPDGKRLAYSERSSQTGFDIWTVALEDSGSDHPKAGKPEPFLVTPSHEEYPMISPDGRWLSYSSDESGRFEVYVRPFPHGDGKWQVSANGGRQPVWSRSRPELFYMNDQGIMVAGYAANNQRFLPDKPRLWAEKKDVSYYDLSPEGTRFAAVEEEPSTQKQFSHVNLALNFFDELRRRVPVEGR